MQFSDAGTYVCEEAGGSKAAAILGVLGMRHKYFLLTLLHYYPQSLIDIIDVIVAAL